MRLKTAQVLAANIRQELGGSAFPITLSDCSWFVASAQEPPFWTAVLSLGPFICAALERSLCALERPGSRPRTGLGGQMRPSQGCGAGRGGLDSVRTVQ